MATIVPPDNLLYTIEEIEERANVEDFLTDSEEEVLCAYPRCPNMTHPDYEYCAEHLLTPARPSRTPEQAATDQALLPTLLGEIPPDPPIERACQPKRWFHAVTCAHCGTRYEEEENISLGVFLERIQHMDWVKTWPTLPGQPSRVYLCPTCVYGPRPEAPTDE